MDFFELNLTQAPNGTSVPEVVQPRSLIEVVFIGLVLGMLIVLTICGNLLVCVTIATNRRLQNPTNYFIAALATTDLLLGVTVLPFSALNTLHTVWPLGAIFCNIYTSCDVMLCTVSILTLFAISLDRYFAVQMPFRYEEKMTIRIVWQANGGIWIFSAIMAFIPIHLGWNTADGHVQNMKTPWICGFELNQPYVLLVALGTYFAPLVIMCGVYLKVLQVTKHQVREINRFSRTCSYATNTKDHIQNGHSQATNSTVVNPDASNKNSDTPKTPTNKGKKDWQVSLGQKKVRQKLASDTKATVTLASVVLCFAVCWVPYFALFTAKPFMAKPINIHMDLFVLWLGYANSMINPFLYGFYNSAFRNAFYRILCRRCYQRHVRNRNRVNLGRKMRLGSSSDTSEMAVLKQSI